MSRLPRAEFVRQALLTEIDSMLVELGNPPLIERIFPNGWQNAPTDKLEQLYDLCLRTYASRSKPRLAPTGEKR